MSNSDLDSGEGVGSVIIKVASAAAGIVVMLFLAAVLIETFRSYVLV